MPDDFFAAIEERIAQKILLFKQPIAHSKTLAIAHYEILSRVKTDGEIIPPMPFIKSLEDHYAIDFLDRYVIAETIHHIIERGDRASYAVNLSAHTINKNGQFIKFLAVLKFKYGLDSLPLIFEITERLAVANTAIAQSVLQCISKSGCPLAVDDFAAEDGAFSLKSLDTLQPTYLKIDGWLTQRLPDPVAIADINAICAIAHARGIKVVLERVESEQLDSVQKLTQVDFIQGYAIGKPESLSI